MKNKQWQVVVTKENEGILNNYRKSETWVTVTFMDFTANTGEIITVDSVGHHRVLGMCLYKDSIIARS